MVGLYFVKLIRVSNELISEETVMSETTPNAKGPAQTQASPELAASLDLTPAPGQPSAEPDVATLALEYRDGQPVVVPSGGNAIPGALAVVGPDGSVVALYEAVAVPPEATGKSHNFYATNLREPFTLLLTFDDFDRNVR